ncbi:adenylate kinase isoenzyme 5 [Cephus cinctus]|uniref:Adenylate kinase isoenzyme 5 n=1 Tax=Cephus cinctus TaxID=211228 RepID=A0AAJ7CCN8_CEPCN|nr:adenylate kinase isoenzyme 5 [Cephus cinctus]
MGICLDTEQQNGSQVFDENNVRGTGRWRGEAGLLATPPDGRFPMQNVGPVNFETPKVPVIFVLGGPGSGKVTHCDNLMHEKKGIVHINMTDLLQQYALGNDMQDFGLLSSKTVAEVLMLEMKMSPGAKTFLVSGYPRNMRDVVEYSERIQIVNGVVLVSWRQEVLERQIDYGAQLGHVILGLARMELHNFYRNVMPVAEYFDQSGMLLAINGERNPSEVYIDFREAVMKILGMSEDENLPRDAPRSLEAEVAVERNEGTKGSPAMKHIVVAEMSPPPPSSPDGHVKPSKTADKPRKGIPSFIWVIGGPGSNKGSLCSQAVRNLPGWVHVSIGGLLRNMASSNPLVNNAIVSGEMVPQDIVMQVVEQQVLLNRDTDGIVIDGFPRDLNQVQEFKNKFGQEPPLLLLDCSKLQLGRGRLDDSVSAFRKRLELFREMSLPMLKTLDNDNRLTIVDGDTDIPNVQEEFTAALYQHAQQARRKEELHPQGPRFDGSDDAEDGKANVTNKSHPNLLAPGNINGGQRIDNSDDNLQRAENGYAKPVGNGLNVLANHIEKRNDIKNNITKNTNELIRNVNGNGNINGDINGGVYGRGNGVHRRNNNKDNIANGQIGKTMANGIDSISKKVQEATINGAKRAIANGSIRIANGIVNGAPVSLQNGAANGANNLLQNGVAHLANGIPANKVAPTVRNFVGNGIRNPVRNMYNEVEGYQENLHI